MRINFLGGAGSGKSRVGAWIFSELKSLDYSVEFAHEFVKAWAYQDRMPRSFDQIKIFGEQMHIEDTFLAGGAKHVVSDSPLWLGPIYARMYANLPGLDQLLLGQCLLYEEKFPSISIYLNRGNKPYKKEGRWGSVEDAKLVDKEVLDFLTDYHKNSPDRLFISDYTQKHQILDFVCNHLEREHATTGKRSSTSAATALDVGTK